MTRSDPVLVGAPTPPQQLASAKVCESNMSNILNIGSKGSGGARHSIDRAAQGPDFNDVASAASSRQAPVRGGLAGASQLQHVLLQLHRVHALKALVRPTCGPLGPTGNNFPSNESEGKRLPILHGLGWLLSVSSQSSVTFRPRVATGVTVR